MGLSPHLLFFLANSIFWTRITSLYGKQTSPVILCMQNRVIITRITSLYGSQLYSVALYIQNRGFRTNIAYLYGSQTYPVILCLKTACLASELLFSMGPRPDLWFLHAKQRLLDPNYKSLSVADITCCFEHEIQRN